MRRRDESRVACGCRGYRDRRRRLAYSATTLFFGVHVGGALLAVVLIRGLSSRPDFSFFCVERHVPRIFDCFMYHSEAYMLQLRLLALGAVIDRFVISFSEESFSGSGQRHRLSFGPFASDVSGFGGRIEWVNVSLDNRRLDATGYRGGETAWQREATVRNSLLGGARRAGAEADDVILLSDVDEIPTRDAIAWVKAFPPATFYNLYGNLYHVSFRWRVSGWERPLAIRFGSISMPLNEYKFETFRYPVNAPMHHHCSFCFPRLSDVISKLRSFSHTEYATDEFTNASYIVARVLCGKGVIPMPRSEKRGRLLSIAEQVPMGRDIFVPDDARLRFVTEVLPFEDLELARRGAVSWHARAMKCHIGSEFLERIPW